MIRKLIATGAVVAAALTGVALVDAPRANACIHPPVEITYPLKPGTQMGLIFFADGRQEMVIRPSYRLELPETGPQKPQDDAHGRLTTLAWVIPVPAVPDSYAEADARLFSDLRDFTPSVLNLPANARSFKGENHARGDAQAAGGIEVHEAVAAGDYTIQPIKAKGELGGRELNAWLKDKGFGEIAADTLKYYLEKDYCWLAVRLHNAKGLPADGEVKPLQIGFATDKPVYPLKINAGSNSFDLELWVVTGREVDLEKTKAFGLLTTEQKDANTEQKNRRTSFANLPERVRKPAETDGLKALKSGPLYCYRLSGSGMNKTTDLAKLENDLHFVFKADPETPPQPKGRDN
ncbi:MAG: DUF2330 domain-containing protein [Planctomycetes bacterium]|jgi:hypothetical protein|nr:DUF2330 domain-containing protein [Planctomycetota bacterium]MCL4731953.1 DUF2330 domain-containing protein [Planctomycetota bacterium]